MARREQPSHVDELGLLDEIAMGALDDDYYEVRPGRYSRGRGGGTLLTAVTLLVFALLVTIAAVQTRTLRPAAQADRTTLISDIERRKGDLDERRTTSEALRTEVDGLEASSEGADPDLSRLQILTGAATVRGEGVSVALSAATQSRQGAEGQVSDRDLKAIVNTLWYAGAEAISINGQRLTSLSSIHDTGGAIAVNYRSISGPYVVLAVGDRDALEQRFNESRPGARFAQEAERRGLGLDVRSYASIDMRSAPAQRLATLKATVGEEQR